MESNPQEQKKSLIEEINKKKHSHQTEIMTKSKLFQIQNHQRNVKIKLTSFKPFFFEWQTKKIYIQN